MNLLCKFIYAKSYDFYDDNDKQVKGCNAYCFDSQCKQIIKVKVVNAGAIEGKKFGDDITIKAIPNGNFIKYEV